MEVEPSINYLQRVEDKRFPLEDAVNKIVNKHTGELQSVINKIKNMINDQTKQLSNIEIDEILLQLPLLLFDLTDDQEIVGLQADFSHQLYKEAYNEAYKITKGTIADKNSSCELTSLVQKMDSIIYDRAYKIIRQQVNMAVEILNSVKKLRDTRQQGASFNNFSNRF